MKKRILSALLAVVMLIGMLPLSVFAEEEAEKTSAYLASYAGDVVVDGSSSEVEWNHMGKLSDANGSVTRPFDILWDDEGLYLSVIPEAGDSTVTFTASDGTTTVNTTANDETAAWGAAVETFLSWNEMDVQLANYGLSIPVRIDLDEMFWEGEVVVISNERLQKATVWNRTDSADDPQNSTNLKTHFMEDGGLRFTRLYGDGNATTDYDAAIYNTGASAFPYLVDGLENTSIEFEFVADAMPAYNSVGYLSGGYAARGFSLSVTDGENNASTSKPDCLSVGITNSNGTMYFIVGHGMNLGTTGSVEGVSTGKRIGERFHVQMLVDNQGNMDLYVDGVFLRTFEKAVIDNYPLGGTNSTSLPVIRLSNYGNPTVDGKKADGSADVDFTIWNFTIGNTQGSSALDTITFDAIKGSNTAADAINSDLVLPTSIENPQLGTVEVVWSSSDETAVSNTGKVSIASVDKTVTLTAMLASDTSVTRSFELKLPKMVMNSTLVEDEIVLDGLLNEASWTNAETRTFSVTIGATGKIASLWKANTAYFAVNYIGADTLELTLGEKTWSFGLTDTIDVENGTITGTAKSGIAELKVDLAAAGIVMKDYNEEYAIQAILKNGIFSQKAQLENAPITLIFSSAYYTSIVSELDVKTTAISGCPGSYSAADGAWVQNSTGAVDYWIKTHVPAISDHSMDIMAEIDLQITALPEGGKNSYNNGFGATGVYLWMSVLDAETPNPNGGLTTNGYYTFATIYNSGSGALALQLAKLTPIALGKNVGDRFTLGYCWHPDDTVTVYVDGTEVGTVGPFTKYISGAGADVLQIRTCSPVSGQQATNKIYSVKITASGEGNVKLEEELSKAKILDGIKLTGLTNDDTITLPGTWETKLGIMTLNWAANNSYITLTQNADGSYTGTVQQPMSKVDVYTHLTMTADGIERWNAEASIVGLQSGMETTADTLRVPFTAAGITLDGATTDEGWSLDIKVLKNSASVGVFGAQWTKDKLYMAVDTKGAALSVNINGKDIDLSGAATSGDIKEFAVAFSDLGVTLEDYGEELDVRVTLGDAVWTGSFVLTSTDWFLTDGVEPRMPVAMKGTVAEADKPTANQGFEDLGNGWRLFDIYNPSGPNPTRIRTYLICWGRDGTEEQQAVYKPLDDRTTPTYTEFDFMAKSMPVYTSGVGTYGATGWSQIFSNYGVTWNVAANSDQPTGGNSLSVSMGIYNTDEGLVFCVLGAETVVIPLNKFLGDQFRLGTSWNVDGSLTVYVDGEAIAVVENAETVKNGYGDESFVLNLIRSPVAAKSAADSFDVYITNISIGKSRGESIFDALSIDDILGTNLDPYAVTADLVLPESIYDDQLEISAPITWTISEPDVVAQSGAVTRPENGGKLVNLTASWNGKSKTFEFYVKGLNYTSNTYVVMNDLDTAKGAGQLYDSYTFTLDTTNNSIIYDQGSSKKINLITLTDGDESNRLNESCLTIWVSDNNTKYTQVKDGFKIKKDGNKVYLYDFVASGRYIKVHCTHYLGDEADFTGPQEQMLQVEWKEYLDPNGDILDIFDYASSAVVENTTGETKYDEIWCVDIDEATDNMLVYGLLNEEWQHLYFYTEDDKVYVRIPEIAAGECFEIYAYYFNADILNLQNKEYALEVVYGTREVRVYDGAGRWIVELPDGRLMAVQSAGDGITENHGWLTYSFSYNNGMTWTEPLEIPGTCDWLRNGGGITYDPNNGRIIVEGYQYVQFVAADVKASDCKLRFVYTDDLGKTWNTCPDVTFENGKSATYVLSYSDPVIVSSYDGEGPNIDMVLNNGVQYDNTGSFCCRVAFTRDAGKTWVLGDDEIRYTPGSGILAYEGGVSEGTILEVKDENGEGTGKLVLYARCQYDNVDVFCKAYSDDYGANWTTAAELSDLYTVNTQPIMHEFGDAQLMFWGGNNVLGGNSYQRMPMNVAISRDDLATFEGIQDLYARYSLQGMTTATRNQIINQSIANQGDTVTLVWDNNFKESLIMRVDNFTEWFYRTKGIWDSFENTTTKAEGWSTTAGIVASSDAHAKEGNFSMKLNAGSAAVRSVPYLQNGSVSFDLYVFENPNFELELESAYGTEYGKAAPLGLRYKNGEMTFLGDDTAYTVNLNANEWNNFTFRLDLDATTPTAELYINGDKVAYVPVNTAIGDYICWLDINTSSVLYLDCLHVDDEDTVIVPEEPEAPTEQMADLPGLSMNLSLNETIDMNFFVKKSLITGDNRIVVRRNGTLLDESEYTIMEYGSTYWMVRYNVKPNKMADIIGVQVVDAQGNAVTREALTSVRGYARLRLANPLIPEAERHLLITMLDYGALTQLFSNQNAVELANRYLEDDDRLVLQNVQWPETNETEDYFQGTGGAFSVYLALNETIDVIFLTAESNLENGNQVQLKRNGKILAASEYGIYRTGDGYYRIRYSVQANEMCDIISVQILDASGNAVSQEGGLSVRSYAMKRMTSEVATDFEKRMLIAMLDYGALAQIYKSSTNVTKIANWFITEEMRALFDGYVYPGKA